MAAKSMQPNKSSIWEGHNEAFATSNANITPKNQTEKPTE